MPDLSKKEYEENLEIAAEYANREFNKMVLADPWCCHSSHYAADVMGRKVITGLIQGHGVESLLWQPSKPLEADSDYPDVLNDAYGYIVGAYVNQGDPYVPTLIFLPSLGDFDNSVQDAVFEHVSRPDLNREGCFIVASYGDILEWLDAADAEDWFDEYKKCASADEEAEV